MVTGSAFTVLGTVVSLLPIANPFSTAAVFLALTERFPEDRAQEQARRACIYMTVVLWVALFAGALVMKFFGISIPALRIAGGVIVARIGFGMLNPHPEEEVQGEERAEAHRMTDLAFTPLAMPMLSGPGSIAVTIGMAAGAQTLIEHLAIAIGIAVVALISWGVLRSARRIVARLGATGMTALTRVMGFLLVCVGIQFLGTGILEFIAENRLLPGAGAGVQKLAGL